MQMAMEMDPRYSFEATEWPNGHYVHTIAGYKEEPAGYNYWLLYRLPELPDPTAPPANQLVAPVGRYFVLIVVQLIFVVRSVLFPPKVFCSH